MKNSAVFKAVAEPRRVELLQHLRDQGEMSVGDLADRVDVTQQAVSLHLKVLEEAGLDGARREGTRHLYSINTDGFQPIGDFLQAFWGEKLKALKRGIEMK